MSPSEQFRKQADIANKLAARSSKEADKAFWLRLAGDWLRLAETAADTDKRQFGLIREVRNTVEPTQPNVDGR